MTIDFRAISSVVGVLGFIISVATFALTRYERRKNLVLEIYEGEYSEMNDGPDEQVLDGNTDIVKIRITNIGAQSVILKPESLYLSGNHSKICVGSCDWIGVEKIPSPLVPNGSCEVALFKNSVIELLNMKSLDKYCNPQERNKTRIDLEVGVGDYKGKTFLSKSFSYIYYIDVFERNA